MTQAAIASAAASAISADIASATSSVASVPYSAGSNAIAAGVSPATSGGASSTVMRFLGGPTETDNLTTTIPVGTTLTFKNLSNNVPHSVTIPAAGGSLPSGPPFQPATGGNTYDGTQLVGSGPIGPGASFAVTFTTAGTYTYGCLFHAGEGMNGQIVVTPATS
jgi:plastocyanin